MSDTPFDDTVKLACLHRELALRQVVYPDRVRKGLMHFAYAERELAIMRAIVRDYERRLHADLFDPEDVD